MKVRNSLKSAKNRDRNCVVVRRRGRVYVINKRNKRFKARQGCPGAASGFMHRLCAQGETAKRFAVFCFSGPHIIP